MNFVLRSVTKPHLMVCLCYMNNTQDDNHSFCKGDPYEAGYDSCMDVWCVIVYFNLIHNNVVKGVETFVVVYFVSALLQLVGLCEPRGRDYLGTKDIG